MPYQYRLIRLFLWFILSEGLSHCATDFLPTNIRWGIRFPAHIQIIRPPLHHRFTGIEIFCFMDVSRSNAVTLLMTHLPFNRILCPQADSIRALQAIARNPWPQISFFVSYLIRRIALLTVFSHIGLYGLWSPGNISTRCPDISRICFRIAID